MALTFHSKLMFAAYLILSMLASQSMSRDFNETSMVEKDEQWMAQYGRVYKDQLGINQFAGIKNEEFRTSRNRYKPWTKCKGTLFRCEYVSAVPSTMDWRKKGAVIEIKNQGQCAIEGIHKLKIGKLISLFEHELVNYDTSSEDQGYEDVPANDKAALLKAEANQSVSVVIDSSAFAFQFYTSGVFRGDCGTDVDYGMTAVGYGTSSDGTKYRLLKNSWGTNWSENGYILIQRDIDTKEGLCGIAMQAFYPTAKNKNVK
ncbi:hypothetical protein ACH5RR_007312 [Cinchona calisaya]|uniref:Peptidase C1A papain C-terminal domain-containing protein n=1 Tax=Cinchona calisaya TaxID=153742 RepID=A0ABD3ARG1_9GENT